LFGENDASLHVTLVGTSCRLTVAEWSRGGFYPQHIMAPPSLFFKTRRERKEESSMTLNVSGYTFEGPYASTDDLEDRSGVYVIVDSTADGYQPIDCGESATVKTRVSTHDRADCWKQNCSGRLMFAVLYTPNLQASGRREIESKIRDEFNFPCGQI